MGPPGQTGPCPEERPSHDILPASPVRMRQPVPVLPGPTKPRRQPPHKVRGAQQRTCGHWTRECVPNPTPHRAPAGSGLSDSGVPRSLGSSIVRGLEGQPRGTHRPDRVPRPGPPALPDLIPYLLHCSRKD